MKSQIQYRNKEETFRDSVLPVGLKKRHRALWIGSDWVGIWQRAKGGITVFSLRISVIIFGNQKVESLCSYIRLLSFSFSFSFFSSRSLARARSLPSRD